MFSYPQWKALLDVTAAVFLLLISSPFLLLLCLFIKWEDPAGPVIFQQKRIGRHNREFTLYKLRSMKTATHRDGRELTDEERLLKIGSFIRKVSLDELPQLWNILKGEMSFIGPRPLLPEYLPYYSETERMRHEVKPGMSGWAQVNGRNRVTWEEKFALDVEYVTNMSFTFDLLILWLTLKKLFYTSDILVAGHETTQDFTEYRTPQPHITKNTHKKLPTEKRDLYG